MDTLIKQYKTAPPVFPFPWADEWGQDRYGIWMAFFYKDIRQCMRWIKPGKFKMGSPETEKERYKDEILHEVILTEGFWLADTTCTQELWQAVMGDNPSRFKGPQRPVDQVSWGDCQTFIKKLKELKPDLELCLPTEAQWEYACRAGTKSPFFFGENIAPEQVNYDGNLPYAAGKKRQNRAQTVDVKSLPCNKWGLYQMHGNIWEWCADWYGDYSTDLVINPTGPDIGRDKVCRGGSWFNSGRDVRSSIRIRFAPDLVDFLGFRFAHANSISGINRQ